MNKPSISVVTPCADENASSTIQNIIGTGCTRDIEIILVDDYSKVPVECPKGVKVIRNPCRYGSAISRDIGIAYASAQTILTVDAHVLFKKTGWAEEMIDLVKANPKSVFCTTCVDQASGRKTYGGRIDFFRTVPSQKQVKVLDLNWNLQSPRNAIQEVLCVMGGAYFFSKSWYKDIRGYKGIRGWCPTEMMALSLRSWLSGGSCCVTRNIEAVHKFSAKKSSETNELFRIRNKMFLSMGILWPSPYADTIFSCLGASKDALQMFSSELRDVMSEREYNAPRRRMTLEDLCGKFGVTLPTIGERNVEGA